MTPKEKAKELVDKFYEILPYLVNEQDAKQCALIAVDELIESYSAYKGMYDQIYFNSESNYWQQVKTEIEKL